MNREHFIVSIYGTVNRFCAEFKIICFQNKGVNLASFSKTGKQFLNQFEIKTTIEYYIFNIHKLT